MEKSLVLPFPEYCELHQLLKENSEDVKQYRRCVESIKSFVLKNSYTPDSFITEKAKRFYVHPIFVVYRVKTANIKFSFIRYRITSFSL